MKKNLKKSAIYKFVNFVRKLILFTKYRDRFLSCFRTPLFLLKVEGIFFFRLILVLLLIVTLLGCGTLKKKFIRKPKEPKPLPSPVVEIKDYSREYNADLIYKNHYIIWKSWHEELINRLDENYKKRLQCCEEAIYNLKVMKEILTDKKQLTLEGHIKFLEDIKEKIKRRQLNEVSINKVKTSLEKQKREIEREFSFSEVKEWIKK